MNVPGFTAEASLYKAKHLYRATSKTHSSTMEITPALPSRQTCDFWEQKCSDCLGTGGTEQSCGFCRALKNCPAGSPPPPTPSDDDLSNWATCVVSCRWSAGQDGELFETCVDTLCG
jgi:hypothetical protein